MQKNQSIWHRPEMQSNQMNPVSRREWLHASGAGLGGLALALMSAIFSSLVVTTPFAA